MSGGTFRRDIQGLRAVAVLLVLAFHLWPGTVTGGYVGVDVFFVISGFLITGHLIANPPRGGRDVVAFWGRRVRRLLPAAFLVLLVTAIASRLLMPDTRWADNATQVIASALYVQNWALASNATDYLAAAQPPTPVQHYWSLSVEEQFYLVWPVLLLVAFALAAGAAARRWNGPRSGRAWRPRGGADGAGREGAIRGLVVARIAMLGVFAASLVISLTATAADPASAYFATPTRVWELAAGGLIATLPPLGAMANRRRLVDAAAWTGLAMVVVAALAFGADTPFPGSAALLPVGGAALAILAAASGPTSPTRFLGARPVQHVGDTSYSIYLWHWPLIILAPFVTHRALDTPTRSLIVVLTLLLAWLSKLGVEDPIRNGHFLTHRSARWTFAAAGAAMAVVLAVTAVGVAGVNRELRSAERATQRVLAQAPSCLGAAAHDPARPCRDPKLRYTVVPTPLQAAHEGHPRCRVVHRSAPEACAFGVPAGKARATVVLLGDSHALALRSAMERVARARRWHGISIYQSTCPFTQATPAASEPYRSRCTRWYRDVLRWSGHHPEVSIVVVSGHRGQKIVVPPGQSEMTAKMNGFARAWNALPRSVKHVVVVRDVPYITERTQDCVGRAIAGHRPAGSACAIPRRVALSADPAALAAQQGLSPRAEAVDLTRFMCDRRACPPVIGGVLVHKYIGHITALFSRTLGPYLLAAVDRLGRGWADVGGRAG